MFYLLPSGVLFRRPMYAALPCLFYAYISTFMAIAQADFVVSNLSKPQRLLYPPRPPRVSVPGLDQRECRLLLGSIEVAYLTHEPGFPFPGPFFYLI